MRIHIDIPVSHNEAPHRLQAALATGGTLVWRIVFRWDGGDAHDLSIVDYH